MAFGFVHLRVAFLLLTWDGTDRPGLCSLWTHLSAFATLRFSNLSPSPSPGFHSFWAPKEAGSVSFQ